MRVYCVLHVVNNVIVKLILFNNVFVSQLSSWLELKKKESIQGLINSVPDSSEPQIASD